MMGNNWFDGNANADMLLAELSVLLQSRRKIEAIKLYRQVTGSDLREAKEAVERVEAALVAGTLSALTASISPGNVQAPGPGIDEMTMLEIQHLIAQHKKIEAIKLYRQVTGSDLREAKEAVDRLERSMLQQGF